MSVTSFGFKVGDAVHDDVVKEEGLVVDLDVSREQATEVVHIPEQGQERVQFNQLIFRINQYAFIWMQTEFLWFAPLAITINAYSQS